MREKTMCTEYIASELLMDENTVLQITEIMNCLSSDRRNNTYA